ncbi:MAG: type 4a pilus biogenesis protein PilO [Gammaproteobacteria bacterium]|nr:type 4a pilus biogenesis protein PilO [Gammaproteobacteria bacterium]
MRLSSGKWSEIEFDRLSSWPRKFRWFVVCLISLGVLLVGEFAFISPEKQLLERLLLREQKKRATFLVRKDEFFALQNEKQQLDKAESKLDLALSIFPQTQSSSEILSIVSEQGMKSGLIFSQLKPDKKVTKTFYEIWPVSIYGEGVYLQFTDFLHEISRKAVLISVEEMSIERSENSLAITATLHGYKLRANGMAEIEGI